jgi:predicted PurR-regulated permease PerM
MVKEPVNIFNKKVFSDIFLLALLIGILYLCFVLISPFIKEIIVSGMLVTIFYPLYLKVVYWTRGRLSLSAALMCFLILLIIIVPISLFIGYLAQQAIAFYSTVTVNQSIVEFFKLQIWQKLNFFDKNVFDVQQAVIDSLVNMRGYIIPGATSLVTGTTNFITSLVIIIFTMFFMFRDGRSLLKRVMELTPLSNKYDKLIWMKFRDVSYTTVVATFITSFAQSFVATLAYFLVGLPFLFLGILTFLLSFVPYVGTSFIWLPSAIYLLIVGKVWQGIFMLLWGFLVVSLIDNILRPYLMKNKTQVHPLIIFFSIFGGIVTLGGWGIIFGPLTVALAITILHIYELEYSKVLER